MPNLPERLRDWRAARTCLVGVGNVGGGDDGFGVRLAEKLLDSGWQGRGCRVLIAGLEPERSLPALCGGGFDHVVFLDAVAFGGEPGAVVLLETPEIAARFPQVSTHKLSLGLLAETIQASSVTKCWLLGVQPASLSAGAGLTPKVQTTLELLADLLAGEPSARNSPGARPC